MRCTRWPPRTRSGRRGCSEAPRRRWLDWPTRRGRPADFRTVLELGYLAASADGLAESERGSLARLLETITGAAVHRGVLERHFADFDDTVASLGRRERLARAAAELEGRGAAEEAIALAALISMADGRLAAPELEVLEELGGHLSVAPPRVRALVDDLAGRVEARLR